MKKLLLAFVLGSGLLAGCARGPETQFQLQLLNPSKVSALNGFYDQPIQAAALTDSCVVSSYRIQALNSDGLVIYDSTDEVIPDLSKVAKVSGTPALKDLVDAFNFKKTLSIPNTGHDPSLDRVEIKFKGLIKLCQDIWGGGGKVKTVTTLFYGSKIVNLNNFTPNSDSLCAGEKNCILVDSYTTSLAPLKLTAGLQEFISTVDKKNFVPIVLTHANVSCMDDAADSSNRNVIQIDAFVEGRAQAISSQFFAHPDYRYDFVSKSVVDVDPNDDIFQIVLASLIVGDTYQITFTQGSGTGCKPGKTKTQTIKMAETDVFNADGTRKADSVEVVFDWN